MESNRLSLHTRPPFAFNCLEKTTVSGEFHFRPPVLLGHAACRKKACHTNSTVNHKEAGGSRPKEAQAGDKSFHERTFRWHNIVSEINFTSVSRFETFPCTVQ